MVNHGDVLWTIGREGHRIECRADFAEGGVEVTAWSDGARLMRRLFPTGTEAIAWAEELREDYAQNGG